MSVSIHLCSASIPLLLRASDDLSQNLGIGQRPTRCPVGTSSKRRDRLYFSIERYWFGILVLWPLFLVSFYCASGFQIPAKLAKSETSSDRLPTDSDWLICTERRPPLNWRLPCTFTYSQATVGNKWTREKSGAGMFAKILFWKFIAVSVNSVNGIKLTNVNMKQIKDPEVEKQLDL